MNHRVTQKNTDKKRVNFGGKNKPKQGKVEGGGEMVT
jgi:hypothetical protein